MQRAAQMVRLLMRTMYVMSANILALGIVELGGCGTSEPDIEGGVVDSSTVDVGPPFAVGLSPSHITEDIGDTYPVIVSLVSNFGYAVTCSVPTADGLSIQHPSVLSPAFTMQVSAVSLPQIRFDTLARPEFSAAHGA